MTIQLALFVAGIALMLGSPGMAGFTLLMWVMFGEDL